MSVGQLLCEYFLQGPSRDLPARAIRQNVEIDPIEPLTTGSYEAIHACAEVVSNVVANHCLPARLGKPASALRSHPTNNDAQSQWQG
jgi:hypothetical protein